MACFHFEFRLSLSYLNQVKESDKEDKRHQSLIAEEESNKKILSIILESLKIIQTK